MKIIKRLFFIATLCLLSLNSFAQMRDVSMSVGINAPMYNGAGSDVVTTLTYGHFYWNGLGLRAGLSWSPSVANIDNAFGVPVALVYRTRAQNAEDRFYSGMEGAAESLRQNAFYGRTDDVVSGFLGAFLMNLISDVEFFAGLTPGYIAGASATLHHAAWGSDMQYWEKTWMEKKSPFSLTADAGICLNYSIWRFDLKLTPAFHYNFINSYVRRAASGEADIWAKETAPKPLKWFFSFSGGLAFRF